MSKSVMNEYFSSEPTNGQDEKRKVTLSFENDVISLLDKVNRPWPRKQKAAFLIKLGAEEFQKQIELGQQVKIHEQ